MNIKHKIKDLIYPKYFYITNNKQMRIVLNLIKKYNKSIKNNDDITIIHSVDLSLKNTTFIVELILALRLRHRGIKSIILIDDGILYHRDRTSLDYLKRKRDNIAYQYLVNRFLSNLGENDLFLKYSDILKKEDIVKIKELINENEINEYNNSINIYDYALSSVIRCAKDGKYDIDDSKIQFYRESIFNSYVSLELAKKIQKYYNPKAILTSHTVYSSWGPFVEYFNKKNIRTITYSKGQNEYNSYFFTDYINDKIRDTNKAWQLYKDLNINDEIIKSLEKYFLNRFNKTNSFTKFLSSFQKEMNAFLPDNKENTFAIFPNVIWDNSLVGSDILFRNIIDWLKSTVRWFIENNEFNLIIRAHPAEAGYMRSLISVSEILKREFGDLSKYKNIFYIPPEANISSYFIFEKIKAAFVYNGTIALELAFKKIPVFLAGKPTFYKKAGFYEFSSKDEYFNKIKKIEDVINYQLENYNSLLKFCYLYFINYEIPLSILKDDVWDEINWNKIDSILEGEDRVFEFILDCIIYEKNDFSEWREVLNK